MTGKRCAIYTRKSSEEGMEQDFNSLHAQREACASYIASQKHEGWQVIKTHYDDGGFSGGNMERPGLQQLLRDIKDNKIDIIVVYKIDRLTRSLLDFARMVEIFDANNVSFVSITQSFNTTTSMGRLTLNVLLSFAQFEREVTGERIRDKIAASKKKGIWMGGSVPLGYEAKDRKLLILQKQAEIVRSIYHRYLELGCVRLLHKDLIECGIRSASGAVMSRGMLYNLLSNPIYIGKIRHKNICYQGQHEPIIDQALWEQVQLLLADNRNGIKTSLRKTDSCPLAGKLFDVSGERLVPVHANKKGRRYRYYISESLIKSKKSESATGWRLPGQGIEQAVTNAALEILREDAVIIDTLQEAGLPVHYIPEAISSVRKVQPEHIIDRLVQSVVLNSEGIKIVITLKSLTELPFELNEITIAKYIPMKIKRRGSELRLIIGGKEPTNIDKALITAIAKAHKWLEQLLTGQVQNIAEIAQSEGIDRSNIAKLINLAFLAPDIIESIIIGQQPADYTARKLTREIDIPLDWARQRKLLV